MNRRLLGGIIFLFASAAFSPLPAAERSGADKAALPVAEYLATLSLSVGERHVMSPAETEALVSLSADLSINVFELMDCVARYALPSGVRLVLPGDSLRALESRFRLGDARVLSILPVEKLDRLEIGSSLEKGENPIDIYLVSEYESFIEIGTAHYEKRFGFAKVGPLSFESCFGIQVSRFLFSAPLVRLELYAPAKGAIYVRGVGKPKRWNLQVIGRIPG